MTVREFNTMLRKAAADGVASANSPVSGHTDVRLPTSSRVQPTGVGAVRIPIQFRATAGGATDPAAVQARNQYAESQVSPAQRGAAYVQQKYNDLKQQVGAIDLKDRDAAYNAINKAQWEPTDSPGYDSSRPAYMNYANWDANTRRMADEASGFVTPMQRAFVKRYGSFSPENIGYAGSNLHKRVKPPAPTTPPPGVPPPPPDVPPPPPEVKAAIDQHINSTSPVTDTVRDTINGYVHSPWEYEPKITAESDPTSSTGGRFLNNAWRGVKNAHNWLSNKQWQASYALGVPQALNRRIQDEETQREQDYTKLPASNTLLDGLNARQRLIQSGSKLAPAEWTTLNNRYQQIFNMSLAQRQALNPETANWLKRIRNTWKADQFSRYAPKAQSPVPVQVPPQPKNG